jgi:hypothetical protein
MNSFKKLKKDRYFQAFIIILIIAFVIRIFLWTDIGYGRVQDDYWMITLANNFIDNFRYELTENVKYDKTQPLFPFLLGISSLFPGNLLSIGLFLTIILSIFGMFFAYKFWEKLENKKIALLSVFFIAFSSIFIKNDLILKGRSLYVLISLISFIFIYKSMKNEKYMPIASVFIVLAAFSRWEGYVLIPVAFFSFLFSKRKEIIKDKKINLNIFTKDYFIISVLIIVVPLFLWSWRSADCCGSWIPSYGYQQQLGDSSKSWQGGLDYLKGIPSEISWPIIFLGLSGLIFSFKRYKEYVPIYLYFIFILFVHLKFRGESLDFYFLTPFFYGFVSIFIFKLKNKLSLK